MRTLELKKKSLEELSKEYGLLTDIEQRGCIGGGDGSYTNPWTWDQYSSNYTCYGGYVDICGQVTYIIQPAVCTASSYATELYTYPNGSSIIGSGILGLGVEANERFFDNYNGTLRFTDSKGSLDIHFYDSGWKGGSRGNYSMSSPLGAGKILTGPQVARFFSKLGYGLSAFSIAYDFSDLITASCREDKVEACLNLAVDCISIALPGWGTFISIAWSGGFSQIITPAITELIY